MAKRRYASGQGYEAANEIVRRAGHDDPEQVEPMERFRLCLSHIMGNPIIAAPPVIPPHYVSDLPLEELLTDEDIQGDVDFFSSNGGSTAKE